MDDERKTVVKGKDGGWWELRWRGALAREKEKLMDMWLSDRESDQG
jgi:hypothetical protein